MNRGGHRPAAGSAGCSPGLVAQSAAQPCREFGIVVRVHLRGERVSQSLLGLAVGSIVGPVGPVVALGCARPGTEVTGAGLALALDSAAAEEVFLPAPGQVKAERETFR